jgi:hypothetical protein
MCLSCCITAADAPALTAGRDALLQFAQLWDSQLVAWLSNTYDAFVTYNVLVHHLTQCLCLLACMAVLAGRHKLCAHIWQRQGREVGAVHGG